MACRRILQLIDSARVREREPARVDVRTSNRRATLAVVSPGLREAFNELRGSAATREELEQRVRLRDGDEAVGLWRELLAELDASGLLCQRLVTGGRCWVTVEPATRAPIAGVERTPGRGVFALSRFALVRGREGEVVLESPLARYRFRLHDPSAVAFVASLVSPQDADAAVAADPRLDVATVRALLASLAGAGIWVPAAPGTEEAGATWELHDLLFHARSRQGWYDDPYGAVGPAEEGAAIPPLRGPVPRGQIIELRQPESITAAGTTLHDALESRRSSRVVGERPLRLSELEELLHRSVAVRRVERYGALETVRCVYPSAGGLGELAVHPVVNRCAGLAPGLYTYDAFAHRLTRRADASEPVVQLLRAAARAAATDVPDVLLVLTARMDRAAWKYRCVAYANVLKGVGALMQTIYLVATAMDLAPCAVGGGDATLFAAASGADVLVEPSVGEFLLNAPSVERSRRQ